MAKFNINSRDSMGIKPMSIDPGRPGGPADPPPTTDPIRDDAVDPSAENPPGFGAKYPHDMYDCTTGKKYVAEDESEHNRYASLGYVHSLSECSNGGSGSEGSMLDNYSFQAFVALAAIGITLIG